MLKSLLILLVGAMAVTGSAGESNNLGPSAVYLKDYHHEAPLNCKGSRAGSDFSIGKEMCIRLINNTQTSEQDSVPDDQEEIAVFECACALATHNIWYKSIADEFIKTISRLIDRIIIGKTEVLKNVPDAVPVNSFNDRVNRLRSFREPHSVQGVQEELGQVLSIGRGLGYNNILKIGSKAAKDVCEDLATSKRWSSLIKPSLEAIERSYYGGPSLKHALLVNQPELDQLVGLGNFCRSLTSQKGSQQ